eukprot:8107804-Pyramimonas_sp.AAC.1
MLTIYNRAGHLDTARMDRTAGEIMEMMEADGEAATAAKTAPAAAPRHGAVAPIGAALLVAQRPPLRQDRMFR